MPSRRGPAARRLSGALPAHAPAAEAANDDARSSSWVGRRRGPESGSAAAVAAPDEWANPYSLAASGPAGRASAPPAAAASLGRIRKRGETWGAFAGLGRPVQR